MAIFNLVLDFDKAERRRIERERFKKTHGLETRKFALEEKKFKEIKRGALVGEGFVGRRLKEAERFGQAQTSVAERSVGVQEESQALAGIIASSQAKLGEAAEKRLSKSSSIKDLQTEAITVAQKLSNKVVQNRIDNDIAGLEKQRLSLGNIAAEEALNLTRLYNSITLAEAKRIQKLPDGDPEKDLLIKIARGYDENQAAKDVILQQRGALDILNARNSQAALQMQQDQNTLKIIESALGVMMTPELSKVLTTALGETTVGNALFGNLIRMLNLSSGGTAIPPGTEVLGERPKSRLDKAKDLIIGEDEGLPAPGAGTVGEDSQLQLNQALQDELQ